MEVAPGRKEAIRTDCLLGNDGKLPRIRFGWVDGRPKKTKSRTSNGETPWWFNVKLRIVKFYDHLGTLTWIQMVPFLFFLRTLQLLSLLFGWQVFSTCRKSHLQQPDFGVGSSFVGPRADCYRDNLPYGWTWWVSMGILISPRHKWSALGHAAEVGSPLQLWEVFEGRASWKRAQTVVLFLGYRGWNATQLCRDHNKQL